MTTPAATARAYELAEAQHGYFAAWQAREAGLDPRTIVMMAQRGVVERVRRGVYRFVRFPASPLGQYVEASLWPHGTRGVVSHESALSLYDLSDVSPATVHITVPRRHRIRRAVPGFLTIHHADLETLEVQPYEGIPVTTPWRTIRDCAAGGLGHGLVRQAIRDGRRLGHLTAAQAAELEDGLGGAFR